MFIVEAVVILVVTLLIVILNALILVVYNKHHTQECHNKYFFCSLTMADLLIGVFVTPLSFLAAMTDGWFLVKFPVCHLQAYVSTICSLASLYSLTWMAIDHYVAVRKVERYSSIMTPMKSRCWIFSMWMSAMLYCAPPLFGGSQSVYSPQAFLCVVNWDEQRAYLATCVSLAIAPPLFVLLLTNCYIFRREFKESSTFWDRLPSHDSRPNAYVRNFVITIVFCVVWAPYVMVHVYEWGQGRSVENTLLPHGVHFVVTWLSISNCMLKFFVYLILDKDFRGALKKICCLCSCVCNPREVYV